MRITRGQLAEIVAEAVRERLAELVEADKDGDEKKHRSKKPELSSADSAPTRSGTEPKDNSVKQNTPDSSDDDQNQSDDGEDSQEDQASSDEEEALDAEGDNGEEGSGAVNNDLSGKTVQSVSIEPKSRVLPGAKEVVLSFNETTDALRILVTATGQVKFFWRGQLHDIP